MKIEKTGRGFEIIEFKDIYGAKCSLQQSSLARDERPGTSAIWLGVRDERMHISLELMEELLPHLQNWVKDGTFDER